MRPVSDTKIKVRKASISSGKEILLIQYAITSCRGKMLGLPSV